MKESEEGRKKESERERGRQEGKRWRAHGRKTSMS